MNLIAFLLLCACSLLSSVVYRVEDDADLKSLICIPVSYLSFNKINIFFRKIIIDKMLQDTNSFILFDLCEVQKRREKEFLMIT